MKEVAKNRFVMQKIHGFHGNLKNRTGLTVFHNISLSF